MKKIIQKQINIVNYELCRIEVLRDANKIVGLEDQFFEAALVWNMALNKLLAEKEVLDK